MKTLFKFIGIVALSAGICGCSALFRTNADAEVGSVSLVLDTHRFAADTRAATFDKTELQVSLQGDYSAEQTVTVSGSQAAVSFAEIPVGSSVSVHISGQTEGDSSFYYGSSTPVTIQKGQNTVVVPIEAKRSTPYVLWHAATNSEMNTQRGLYATQTLKNFNAKPTVEFDNASEFMGFCFDNDANLYIIHRISDTTSEVTITLKKYAYSEKDASYNPELASRPLTDLTANTHSLFVTCDNDNLYIATGRETSDSSPIALYYAPRETALETSAKYKQIPADIDNSAAVELTAIAAADGTIYLAYSYTPNSASSNDTDLPTSTITIAAYGTDGTKKAEASDVANMLGLETRADVDTQISDLLVQDGVLYALISQLSNSLINIPSDSENDPQQYLYYSRGGVAKFSASNLTPDKSFGENGIRGWTTEKRELTSSSTVTGYWPAQDATSFYGPVRFAAIRPKKLVIADDGASIENADQPCEQKNAIMEIDLASATLTRTEVPVEFDRNIYVSF